MQKRPAGGGAEWGQCGGGQRRSSKALRVSCPRVCAGINPLLLIPAKQTYMQKTRTKTHEKKSAGGARVCAAVNARAVVL